MNRIAPLGLALALIGSPALAVTNDNGDILITAAAVNAGGITPGDTPGFPATISVPGSYRLASNLTVTTAVNGIEVRANEVSIDMGGFTLAGSGIGRNGITSFNRTLTVQHGTVRGFALDGVRTAGPYMVIDRMRVLSNGRSGVVDAASGGNPYNSQLTVTNSTVSENVATGISCSGACLIEGNSVSRNGSFGVSTQGYATVLGNIILKNGNRGIYGYGGFGNNTIVGNTPEEAGSTFHPLDPNYCGYQVEC